MVKIDWQAAGAQKVQVNIHIHRRFLSDIRVVRISNQDENERKTYKIYVKISHEGLWFGECKQWK